MPLTPFHFGIALLIWSLFIFLDPIALFIGSVILDVEGVLWFFGLHDQPHGISHTIISAIAAAFILAIFLNKFFKRKRTFAIILLSSLIGTFSHILIDSTIYPEMNLAWPLNYWNPLFGLIAQGDTSFLGAYLYCIYAFAIGLVILGLRKYVLKLGR